MNTNVHTRTQTLQSASKNPHFLALRLVPAFFSRYLCVCMHNTCGYKSPAPCIWLWAAVLRQQLQLHHRGIHPPHLPCFLSLPFTSCSICFIYSSSLSLKAKVKRKKKCCVIALRRHPWFSLWQPIVLSFCPLRARWFVFLLSLPWHRPENADTVWHFIPPGRVRLSAVCVHVCVCDSFFMCTVGLNMMSTDLV